MRKWIIAGALLANALLGGLVLLLIWDGGGWGEAVRLSATETRLLVVVAAAALVLDALLAPVLGISFWSRDRGTRTLERRLAASEAPRRPVVVVDEREEGREPGEAPAGDPLSAPSAAPGAGSGEPTSSRLRRRWRAPGGS